ncbi:MAG TPA: Gfo/Idh/MocA family oxidoreductase [Armatimonadota bacterium]|nr:Gfo/Idh/MocA family oxidoreductase [Armatimonadota bacterium]
MTVNVAIIGAGFMGRAHAESYYKGELGARVTRVVASRRALPPAPADLPGAVRAGDDFQAALDDPAVDMVDICVPTMYHADCVLRAAAAGKHVLCEKPMAVTLEEADAMIAACKTAGVRFMIAHVLRFWPEYRAVVEMVRAGRIGRLRQVVCRRLSQGPAWNDHASWFLDPARGGGAVRDLAIHDYDVIAWLAGLPMAVRAMGDVNHFTALFALPDGVFAQVEASMAMPAGFPFTMSLMAVGEDGVAIFDGRTGAVTLIAGGEEQAVTVEGSRVFAQNTSAEIDAYYHEIAYFLECVRAGAEPARATPESSRDALALAIRVQAALEGA